MIAQAFQTQGDMRDVLRPDVYHGAREDDACWRWLLTYDNWFDTRDKITGKDIDDTLKIVYAEGRCRGQAQEWVHEFQNGFKSICVLCH